MDMNHYKFTDSSLFWDQNTDEQHHLVQDQWFYYPPIDGSDYSYNQFISSSAAGGGGSTNVVDSGVEQEDEHEEELGAMKEMMFKIAAMQPVDIDLAMIRKPRRRNVRISDDPQSVAARHRRERISEKMRILQRLVPDGTKMDTASMLDEAVRYVKFLKKQIRVLQVNNNHHHLPVPVVPPATTPVTADPWTYMLAGNCTENRKFAGDDN